MTVFCDPLPRWFIGPALWAECPSCPRVHYEEMNNRWNRVAFVTCRCGCTMKIEEWQYNGGKRVAFVTAAVRPGPLERVPLKSAIEPQCIFR